ncbi:MAG: hypothetical protein IKO42_01930 [Opitutales bacterium]|nr:hypothetical protein [Opitutales bacterium]
MFIDINKIRANAKLKLTGSPQGGKLRISTFKRSQSTFSERLRAIFGALILIALIIAGAYMIWTLASQSARYVEIQADKKDAEQTQQAQTPSSYEITYKPAAK